MFYPQTKCSISLPDTLPRCPSIHMSPHICDSERSHCLFRQSDDHNHNFHFRCFLFLLFFPTTSLSGSEIDPTGEWVNQSAPLPPTGTMQNCNLSDWTYFSLKEFGWADCHRPPTSVPILNLWEVDRWLELSHSDYCTFAAHHHNEVSSHRHHLNHHYHQHDQLEVIIIIIAIYWLYHHSFLQNFPFFAQKWSNMI